MATIINDSKVRVFRDYHPDLEDDTHKHAPPMNLESDIGTMSKDMEKVVATSLNENKEAMVTYDKTVGKKKKLYQWTTKNKSFIELHNDLKVLGVKNNKFFLRLYDETLMDIDPYALGVPPEIQARIIIECIRNPWYFLREICRIPVDGKPICPGGGTSFIADRNNIATWYLFLNGIDHYSSKPRQRGKTQDALAKLNYSFHFGCTSATITLANKDFTLNKMNLSRLKTQRDMLPLYLQMKLSIDQTTGKVEKEQNNVLSMGNPINFNKIQLLPSASTSAKAQSVGRGVTSAIVMYDEFDWMPYNMDIYYASSFSYKTASDNAKKNMSLYGRIFTSTPGNMETKEGQNADIFINGDTDNDNHGRPMLKWKDNYFDLPIEKLKSIVNSKSYNGIVYVEHTWQQLKCDNKWYEEACRGVNYNPEQIAREILLKRLRGSSKSPFKRTQLMGLLNNVESPIDEVDYTDNLCPFFFYEKLNKRTPYLIAIDPAEGLSGDNLAVVGISPFTEKVAFEFKTPYINQTKMAKILVKFMDNYCPRGLIIIENNRGRELINQLLLTKYADHLWYDTDKLDKKETINTKDLDPEAERAIGWNTSPKTRPMMMATLETIVVESPEKANSKFVVDDICSLERVNGSIKAAPGKHDDVALAFSMGHTVYRTATNLSNWGIYPGMKEAPNLDPSDPQYKKNALAALMEYLPDELKQIFVKGVKKDVNNDNSVVRSSIEREAAMIHIQEVARKSQFDEDAIDETMIDNDELYEEVSMEEFYNQAVYNPDANLDLSDYF